MTCKIPKSFPLTYAIKMFLTSQQKRGSEC